MTTADIVSVNRRIGRLRIDASGVRGEGGALSPVLVVGISAELEPRPEESKLVLTAVRAALFLGGSGTSAVRLTESAPAQSQSEGLWASHPSTTIDHAAEIRFPLSPTHVHLLEAAASQDARAVAVTLKFWGEAAWVQQEHDGIIGPSSTALSLAPLAWMRVADATVNIPRSEWSEQILPGLGLDSVRLVSVRLPRGGPLREDLVAWFDQARVKFDMGDYRGAIERARDVRNAVEKHLGANRADPVSSKVQTARHLPDLAPITEFLDGVWQALADVTNEAHHPDRPDQPFNAADARAVLLSTAVVLEYLASSLSPGAL
jgi:hypothetical protein